MAQPEDVAALLEGSKANHRGEFAMTAEMNGVIELVAQRQRVTRSQALRILIARGAATMPGLIGEAVQAVRESPERD